MVQISAHNTPSGGQESLGGSDNGGEPPEVPGARPSHIDGAETPMPDPAWPPKLPPDAEGPQQATMILPAGEFTVTSSDPTSHSCRAEAHVGHTTGQIEAKSSANTQRAYASDWRHFSAWCRRQSLSPLPSEPQKISRYITALASATAEAGGNRASMATIRRRLSSLSWSYAQRGGQKLDLGDQHIVKALADIREHYSIPARKKDTLHAQDVIAMLETLDRGTLRGLRDRAMLLIGFSGRLRRSEIVGLDCGADQSKDGRGWIEIFEGGMVVTLSGKTGGREIKIQRSSSDTICPVLAIETWMRLARVNKGPLFRRVRNQGRDVGADRLNDQEVARLVKKTAIAAGLHIQHSDTEHRPQFSGQSLRTVLTTPAKLGKT